MKNKHIFIEAKCANKDCERSKQVVPKKRLDVLGLYFVAVPARVLCSLCGWDCIFMVKSEDCNDSSS